VTRIKFEELSFEKLIGEGNYGDVHKGKYFELDVGAFMGAGCNRPVDCI
jgi:hypothetical protein